MMGGNNKFQESFVCNLSYVIKNGKTCHARCGLSRGSPELERMGLSSCLYECLWIGYIRYIISSFVTDFTATANYLLYIGYIEMPFSLVNVNILTDILTLL